MSNLQSLHSAVLEVLVKPAALLLLGGALALSPVERAHAAPPRTDGIDLQQFRPGGGASDYLHLQGGFLARHLGFTLGTTFDFADGLLLTVRDGDGPKSHILDSQATLNLFGSIGFWERFELGLAMPLVLTQSVGPGWDETMPGMPTPGSFALGDLRLTPKVRLVETGRQFSLALAVPVSLPIGQSFAGYGAISFEPKVILDWSPAFYFRLTANIGGRLREKAAFDGLNLGEEITWGLGMKLSFFLGDQLMSVLTSFSGSFELPEQSIEAPPFEFLGGLEWRALPDLSVYAAAGAGLTRGYGSPDSRVLVGLRLGGHRDCAYGPEDLDGFEDDDDCADLDNDLDTVTDALDLCPNEPETRNGLDDADGCPDERLVLATLLDGRESPDLMARDTDQDGRMDGEDQCPDLAEDFDGFEDLDGCPEPDNDSDGILDLVDRCATSGETVNAFEDDDGCPDVPSGPVQINDLSRQITITDKIYFDTGKATIQSRSFDLLNAIADVLKARPDIAKLRVEGHTDDAGPADFNRKLSGDRANAVVTYLISRGIAEARVVGVGIGEDEPIESNRTAKGKAANRRVEFEIVEYSTEPESPTRDLIPIPE
jgi:outer membrane protein OmpA-like peptidoglycan-associated protein